MPLICVSSVYIEADFVTCDLMLPNWYKMSGKISKPCDMYSDSQSAPRTKVMSAHVSMLSCSMKPSICPSCYFIIAMLNYVKA